MELSRKLYNAVAATAERVMVEAITIGTGYTAVTLSDGGIGIAATGESPDEGIAGMINPGEYQGRPAIKLLGGILSTDIMQRAVALALINALNHASTLQFSEDFRNRILFGRFGILDGARVAMVGYFPPLVRLFEKKRIPLSIIDNSRGIGDKNAFNRQLGNWADVLLLTATSITNNTMEDLLGYAGGQLKTVVIGPSTPMLPAVFDHLPVHMLAGTAIIDHHDTLAIIKDGGGTRSLKPVSRKVYWHRDEKKVEPVQAAENQPIMAAAQAN